MAGGREGGRKGGRDRGTEGGREEEREGGREGGREGEERREGGSTHSTQPTLLSACPSRLTLQGGVAVLPQPPVRQEVKCFIEMVLHFAVCQSV